jgi:hypothetical protein
MEKAITQLVDSKGVYRSLLFSYGVAVDFKSANRMSAIVYSEDELEVALEYYKKRGIDIIIEKRVAVTTKEI